jgi:hypothetical protein
MYSQSLSNIKYIHADVADLETARISSLNIADGKVLADSKSMTVNENLVVNGDLVVNGENQYISTTNLLVTDNLLKIAEGNTSSNVDIGFYAPYGSNKNIAFFHDHNDQKFKVINTTDLSVPSITLPSSYSYNDFQAANIYAANFYKTGTSDSLNDLINGVASLLQTHKDDTKNPHSVTASQLGLGTSNSPTFSGLTLSGLNGVLKASSGVVSGSASTSDLTEGSNLYYTDSRARAAFSAGTNLSYSSGVYSLISEPVLNGLKATSTFALKNNSNSTIVSIDQSGNLDVLGLIEGRNLVNDGAALDSHIANTSNPHSVTRAQLGVGTGDSPVFSNCLIGTVNGNSTYAGIKYTGLGDTNYMIMQYSAGNTYVNCGSGTMTSFRIGNSQVGYYDASDWKTSVNFVCPTLSVGSLSGVLKASSGVVSGSATTSDLTEGSNLYYTNARARAALSAGTNISYDSSTGAISCVSAPNLNNVNLSSLTASQYVKTDSSKNLTSVSLIPTSDIDSFNSTVRGLFSGVDINYDSSTGVISNPQGLAPGNAPTFNGLTTTNFTQIYPTTQVSPSSSGTYGLRVSQGSSGPLALGTGSTSTYIQSFNLPLEINTLGNHVTLGEISANFYINSLYVYLNQQTANSYLKTGLAKEIISVSSVPISDVSGLTGGAGIAYSSGDISVDYNSTNLKMTAGQLNTIQDIATNSSVIFNTVSAKQIVANPLGSSVIPFVVVSSDVKTVDDQIIFLMATNDDPSVQLRINNIGSSTGSLRGFSINSLETPLEQRILCLQRYGGNVGINTITPAAQLDVNGNVKVESLTASNYVKTDGSKILTSVSSVPVSDVSGLTGGSNISYSSGVISLADSLNITSLSCSYNAGGTILYLASGNGGAVDQGAQIRMTNNYTSATNPNKYLRVNQYGEFQIVDSGYANVIFSLDNSGLIYANNIRLDSATASRLVSTDGGKQLISTNIVGTTNQVSVSGVGTSTITLSTPQNIGTGSSPTFAGLTLSGNTTDTLCYHNASKEIKSVTIGDGLDLSGGTLSSSIVSYADVYTPTITNASNCTFFAATPCFYSRSGDYITVRGYCGLAISASVQTYGFYLTLPENPFSNFSNSYDLIGTGFGQEITNWESTNCQIAPRISHKQAHVFTGKNGGNFVSGSFTVVFQFTYYLG